MRTWNDYKAHVKSVDAQARGDMEQIEEIAEIVGAMVEQRNAISPPCAAFRSPLWRALNPTKQPLILIRC